MFVVVISFFLLIKEKVYTNSVALLSTRSQLICEAVLSPPVSLLQMPLHLHRRAKHQRQIWISCHILRTLCFITLDDCGAEIVNETCLTATRETQCCLDKQRRGTDQWFGEVIREAGKGKRYTASGCGRTCAKLENCVSEFASSLHLEVSLPALPCKFNLESRRQAWYWV